jgi:hypothetical protein
MLSKKVIRVIQLFFICEILFFEIRPLFGKGYKEVVANSGYKSESEGGINSGWCTSGGNFSHLLEKGTP